MSKKKIENSKAKRIVKFQAINAGVYLLFFIAFSGIALAADIKSEYICYLSFSFIGLSSFMSGFIAGIRERKNGIVIGIISALPLNVIFMLIGLMLNGFYADINLLICAVIGVVLSAIGGILSVNIRLK